MATIAACKALKVRLVFGDEELPLQVAELLAKNIREGKVVVLGKSPRVLVLNFSQVGTFDVSVGDSVAGAAADGWSEWFTSMLSISR